MRHSLWMMVVAMAVVACKPTVPSAYIQPDELEDMLYDYHLAEAMARSQGGQLSDIRRTAYFQAVLKKYDVTEADFDSSLVYYYSHVDRLKGIYSRVNERLAVEAKRVGATVGDISHYSQYSTEGDTANIWRAETDVLLVPRPTVNRYDFTVKADSTYRVGDTFMFQFMSEFIWQNGGKEGIVYIKATYEGDSIVQVSTNISFSGLTQLRVPANHSRRLRQLRGFIYLFNGEEYVDNRRLMFISQLQLIRFHPQQMPATHDSETKDSLQTNSVQRDSHPGGQGAEPLRRRVVERTHVESSAANGRATTHRVDARADRTEKGE